METKKVLAAIDRHISDDTLLANVSAEQLNEIAARYPSDKHVTDPYNHYIPIAALLDMWDIALANADKANDAELWDDLILTPIELYTTYNASPRYAAISDVRDFFHNHSEADLFALCEYLYMRREFDITDGMVAEFERDYLGVYEDEEAFVNARPDVVAAARDEYLKKFPEDKDDWQPFECYGFYGAPFTMHYDMVFRDVF